MRYKQRTRSPKTATWLKMVAWAVGASLILFISFLLFTFWLGASLERMVAKQSNEVYSLELYGLKVSPFLGSLSVDSLSLEPDFDRWKALSRQGRKTPRTLLSLKSGRVSLRDLRYWKALTGQQVQLEQLEVTQPELFISAMEPDTTSTPVPLHEMVQGFLSGLKIGKIDARQANLYFRQASTSDMLLSVRNFDLMVQDFRLDSSSFQARERAYYARSYTMEAAQIAYLLPEEHSRLTFDSVFVCTKAGTAQAHNIKLEPLLDPAALARAKGKAVTHQELEAKQIHLRGVDFSKHSRGSGLWIRHVLLQTPSLVAFKDKQHFQDIGEKPLPHEIVQQLKMPFLIDSLEIRQGYVRYAELAPQADERGHITFHKLQALVTNLSNIPRKMSMDNPTIVQAAAMVMDRAKLEVTIRLPLLQENGYHTIEGTIGATNLQLLNPILIPTGFVRIERGQVRDGLFKIELNRHQANGSLHLRYQDLKIDLLSGSDGEQGLGMKVLSKAANTLVIKEHNPAEGEEPRLGSITVSRNLQKSVFTYWKDCLLSGFLSVIGAEAMAKK